MWKPRLNAPRWIVSRFSGKRPPWAFAIALAIVLSIVLGALSIKMFAGPRGGLLVARHNNLVWRGSASRRAVGASKARVAFELDNVGGRPVQILSVESGCGCARPVVRPGLVAPGHSATVEVTAMMVPVGEKVVRFKLRTDSPAKPELELTLKMVATQKPPFLYLTEGEAVFRGEYSAELSREIAFLTVESHDQGDSPEVSTDLPFLKLTLKGVEVKPFIEPGTLLHRWRYLVEFKDRPPSGSFQGTITAKSPWDRDETLSLKVVGQLRSGIVAYPSVITIDRSGREQASLLIVCSSPGGMLDLQLPSGIPLIINQEQGDKERKVHRVKIGLGGSLASGDTQTRITIRQPGTAEQLVVPVKIISKESEQRHKNG
jgi:hypothetical protein